MSKMQMILALVLVDFAAFTGWTIYNEGIVDAFAFLGEHLWTMQVGIDLVLAITFITVWMWRDARKRGVNPIPWVLLTVVTGSLGWLTYLVARPGEEKVFGGERRAVALAG